MLPDTPQNKGHFSEWATVLRYPTHAMYSEPPEEFEHPYMGYIMIIYMETG